MTALKKPSFLVYAIASHAVALASFAWFALWVYRIGGIKNVDTGPPGDPAAAFALDTVLLGVYCAGHSLFARSSVKRWTRRFVPHALERATYCLIFGVLLVALLFAWRPLPHVLWRITSPGGLAAIGTLFVLWWVVHFGAIFWMGYGEFFGLRQAWLGARGEEYRPPRPMTRRSFAVSHVLLVVSLALLPWATPTMSVGQLYFCSFLALYDVVGAWLSARDLSDVPAPVADARPEPTPAAGGLDRAARDVV